MSVSTYYVVQPFLRSKRGRLVPGPAQQFRSQEQALKRGRRFGDAASGAALVFERSGDPDVGDFDDMKVLGTFGDLPDEVLGLN